MAPVRWGILSTAHINRKLLAGAALSSEVEVVAVGSRDLARARAFADEHGIPAAYGSYEELLADPAVEAIYNPLPNTLHCEWSIRALEAGKHVLCEKPMSSSAAEVEQAFAAAERTGLLLTEAFMYRHHPQAKRLAALVAEGAIGAAARDPQRLQLRALRRVEHPPAHRRRRRRADGCRVLLRQRLAPARRRARSGLRPRVHRADGDRLGVHGVAALPGRRARAVRLRNVPPQPRRARGDRLGRLALPRRSVALPEPGDRAPARRRHASGSRWRRRIRISSSSRISAARSARAAPRCSDATMPSRRRA